MITPEISIRRDEPKVQIDRMGVAINNYVENLPLGI